MIKKENPLLVERADTIEDPGRDLRRESQRGLVEQQQIGIHHQRPCDLQQRMIRCWPPESVFAPLPAFS